MPAKRKKLESKPAMARQNKQNRMVKRQSPMKSMCQLTKASKRVSFGLFHMLIGKIVYPIRLLVSHQRYPVADKPTI